MYELAGAKIRHAKPFQPPAVDTSLYRARRAHSEHATNQRAFVLDRLKNSAAKAPNKGFKQWWCKDGDEVLFATRYGKRQVYPPPDANNKGETRHVVFGNLEELAAALDSYAKAVMSGDLDELLKGNMTTREVKKKAAKK